MDRRKTEAELEERTVQKYAIRVYKDLQRMSDKAGPEEDWTTRGLDLFGEAMGDLLRILEAVETGVEVDSCPRAMYQASLENKGRQAGREQNGTRVGAAEMCTQGLNIPQKVHKHAEEGEDR
jgi:hypothetical protein